MKFKIFLLSGKLVYENDFQDQAKVIDIIDVVANNCDVVANIFGVDRKMVRYYLRLILNSEVLDPAMLLSDIKRAPNHIDDDTISLTCVRMECDPAVKDVLDRLFRHEGQSYLSSHLSYDIIRELPEEVLSDRNVLLAIFSQFGANVVGALHEASRELIKNDREIILSGPNYLDCSFASEEIRMDRNFLLGPLWDKWGGQVLMSAADGLKNDREFVKEVMRRAPGFMFSVPEQLLADREIVEIILSDGGEGVKGAFKYVPKLKQNTAFVKLISEISPELLEELGITAGANMGAQGPLLFSEEDPLLLAELCAGQGDGQNQRPRSQAPQHGPRP